MTSFTVHSVPAAPARFTAPRLEKRGADSVAGVAQAMVGRAAAAALAFCATICGAAAETYTLTQILPPPGASSSSVASVNNLGQVAGNTRVKSGRSEVPGHAFVWVNGTATPLPSLGAASSARVNAISDSGLLAGYSPAQAVNDPANPRRAVWWQPAVGGGFTVGDWNVLLPAGSPLFLSEAVALSKDGQFVVFDARNTQTGRWYPVVAKVEAGAISTWSIETAGDPAEPLYDCLAADIHHDPATGSLRVVGYYAKTATDTAHAFIWQKSLETGAEAITQLDGLNRHSFAEAVNGAGETVGDINVNGVYRAHFWSAAGVPLPLPTLGGSRSGASSINEAGYVTGSSLTGGRTPVQHAFLWHASRGIRDLNLLKSDSTGVELTTAIKSTMPARSWRREAAKAPACRS